MDLEEITKTLIPHLSGQFERALPILFTGSGFSLPAKNLQGDPLPTVDTLKNDLWNLCFPDDPFEPAISATTGATDSTAPEIRPAARQGLERISAGAYGFTLAFVDNSD